MRERWRELETVKRKKKRIFLKVSHYCAFHNLTDEINFEKN